MTIELAAYSVAPCGIIGGLFGVIIGIAVFVFWLWMLVDCLSSSMPPPEKILWFLVIFFLPFLGSLLYYLLRRSPRAGP